VLWQAAHFTDTLGLDIRGLGTRVLAARWALAVTHIFISSDETAFTDEEAVSFFSDKIR
jgi:hypothetical protein